MSHVEQMSGAKLEVRIEPDRHRQATRSSSATAKTFGRWVWRSTQRTWVSKGFVIKSVGNHLVIAGGRQRGTMYGVFTLLEKLGCRWWYPGASTIPKTKTITVPPLDERQVPVLEYRDFLYGEMDNSEEAMIWRARNKVNGGFHKDMKPEYGGAYKFHTLVHSYDQLMPPSRYFAAEPARYALRGGNRNAGQPCFSNPAVVRTMADSILRLIDQHRDWRFFTIGQNDNSNYCQCDDCNALAERYESHGGSQVHFAKEIGKIVWRKHPDVILNVPAYRWTRKPPKNIDLDPRMAITLCSIECNFGQPLAEGYPDENAAFKADIEGWSKIAPRLFIWDYTTNFTHYLLPYPNYYVLAPNVKFYADHKARGIMHQGSHTTRHGQLAPLSHVGAGQGDVGTECRRPEAGRGVLPRLLRTGGGQADPAVPEHAARSHRQGQDSDLVHAMADARNVPVGAVPVARSRGAGRATLPAGRGGRGKRSRAAATRADRPSSHSECCAAARQADVGTGQEALPRSRLDRVHRAVRTHRPRGTESAPCAKATTPRSCSGGPSITAS